MAYPETKSPPDLPYPMPDPPTFNPIVPFETLPIGVQIFLAFTAILILWGCVHIAWKMIRTTFHKKD